MSGGIAQSGPANKVIDEHGHWTTEAECGRVDPCQNRSPETAKNNNRPSPS